MNNTCSFWCSQIRANARQADNKANAGEDFDETMLGVLDVVELDPPTSQRVISRELGVALGSLLPI
jgi:hypothetical protein